MPSTEKFEAPEIPSWSGKSLFSLSLVDIEVITHFCIESSHELGVEAALGDQQYPNPFHPWFLSGVPYMVYANN